VETARSWALSVKTTLPGERVSQAYTKPLEVLQPTARRHAGDSSEKDHLGFDSG
jgi:hypothetical protein